MDSLQARTAAMRVLFKSDMAGVLAITGGDEFEGLPKASDMLQLPGQTFDVPVTFAPADATSSSVIRTFC